MHYTTEIDIDTAVFLSIFYYPMLLKNNFPLGPTQSTLISPSTPLCQVAHEASRWAITLLWR